MSYRVRFRLLQEIRTPCSFEPYPALLLAPRWRWLARPVNALLGLLGATTPIENPPTYRESEPIDLTDLEGFGRAAASVVRAGGRMPVLMVGREAYAELRRRLGPVSGYAVAEVSYLTGERNERTFESRVEIMGQPVVLNPWMEGSTLVPAEVVEAILAAYREVNEPRRRETVEKPVRPVRNPIKPDYPFGRAAPRG